MDTARVSETSIMLIKRNQVHVIGDWDGDRGDAVWSVLRCYAVCWHGLLIVIDDHDYPEWKQFAGRRGLATHVGRAGLTSDRVSPPMIRDLLMTMRPTHLIWISGKTKHAGLEELVWDLAHEVRHFHQERDCAELLLAGGLLRDNGVCLWGENELWMRVPTELDAELAAWRVSREVSGEAATRALVERHARHRPRHVAQLRESDPDQPYPVYSEAIALLQRCRVALGGASEDTKAQVEEYAAGLERRLRVRGSPYL
jgi:hypothetical protein